MCGIAGYWGNNPASQPQVDALLRAMTPRGPDHQGFRALEQGESLVQLLHSRLAIVDLDPRSQQPFFREGLHLIFNGEIYNYRELRSELVQNGVRFTTSSDTEVLLESYRAWGIDCLQRFEGMWGFALFDENQRKLWLSRDRFGEKPLYYAQDGANFAFASQTSFLRCLLPFPVKPNIQRLLRGVVLGYRTLYQESGETFFENLFEVPAGSTILFEYGAEPVSARYFLPTSVPKSMTFREAAYGARERLERSLELRLRADVPIAFCLSGGVDSASLASLAVKKFNHSIHCYSIVDTDPRYDELNNIQATVGDLGCKSTCVKVPKSNNTDRLRSLIAYHDAPIATSSYVIHSYLSERIAADGYKVVISGTSGDELFSGYYDHYLLQLHELNGKSGFESALNSWRKYVEPTVRNPKLKNPYLYLNDSTQRAFMFEDVDYFSTFLKAPLGSHFKEQQYCDSLFRNRMLNELCSEVTPVILHEDDLNSAMFSLENRSPFLDIELYRFAYSIPSEHLIRDGYGKAVLREAVTGILNEQVRSDRVKKGFNASIDSLFDLTSPEICSAFFAQPLMFEYFKSDMIEQLLQQTQLTNSESKFLFSFLNMSLFLEHCQQNDAGLN